MWRLALVLLVLPLLCLGCGGGDNSGAETAATGTSTDGIQATFNQFVSEAHGDGQERMKACAYLTPNALHELLLAIPPKDPGVLGHKQFESSCAHYLAAIADGSAELPEIEVQKAISEEIGGRKLLLIEVQKESIIAMNSAGTKILSFGIAGPPLPEGS